jgi:hypothetical protein
MNKAFLQFFLLVQLHFLQQIFSKGLLMSSGKYNALLQSLDIDMSRHKKTA